jgi:hypothetical protein
MSQCRSHRHGSALRYIVESRNESQASNDEGLRFARTRILMSDSNEIVSRSATDRAGRPYPLLLLEER